MTARLPPSTHPRDGRAVARFAAVLVIAAAAFAAAVTRGEPWWSSVLLTALIAAPFLWRLLLPVGPDRITVDGDGTVVAHGRDGVTRLAPGGSARTGVFRAVLRGGDGTTLRLRHVAYGRWGLIVALVERGWSSGTMVPTPGTSGGPTELTWTPRELPPARDVAPLLRGAASAVAAGAVGSLTRGATSLGLSLLAVAVLAVLAARLLPRPTLHTQRLHADEAGVEVDDATGTTLRWSYDDLDDVTATTGTATRSGRLVLTGRGRSGELLLPGAEAVAVRDLLAMRRH